MTEEVKKTEEKPKEELITFQDTIFELDEKGDALPQKVQIEIYDRELRGELLGEVVNLNNNLNKLNSSKRIFKEIKRKNDTILNDLKKEIDDENDDIKRKVLQSQYEKQMEKLRGEEVKNNIFIGELQEKVEVSRYNIKKLKEMIDETKIVKFAKMIPLKSGQAQKCFTQFVGPNGEKTDDYVIDIISYCLKEPRYTLDQAKSLRPEFRSAFEEAIMEISGYKTKSYREVLIEMRMSELKKKDSE